MIENSITRYRDELDLLRLRYSKTGCIVSASLILAGAGLDRVFYPDQANHFLLLRLSASGATIAILLIIRILRKRHIREITWLWLSLPQIMIAWMIYSTDGAASIYFVGLILALYAIGIILPLSRAESIAFGLFTCVLFLAACLLHPETIGNLDAMVGRLLFIVFSVAISVVCNYYNEQTRLKTLALQKTISAQNQQLLQANQELAQAKDQLFEQEKMAALGTLSAGLLHEVNNPVNYSLMAIEIALREIDQSNLGLLHECLTDARDGMRRVQNIVTDLKVFAYQKPGEDRRCRFAFAAAVDAALRLTSYELKDIVVRRDLPQDTNIVGDEPALIGVLINLFSNAALALRQSVRETAEIMISANIEADRLHVVVRDNGTGIAAENLGRVFEPFFTTRDVGKGLGLGLSVSYAVIQRHGSVLQVSSEPGVSTTFEFDLPRVASAGADELQSRSTA
jgi:two-component system sensor histidine kinase PhcS